MFLNSGQTCGQLFLPIARFCDHREGDVELLATHKIETACDSTGALFRLCLQFVTGFGQVAENAGSKR